jgi:diaminopimelate epimerase
MRLKKAGAMDKPLNVQARGGLLKVTYESKSNHIFLQGPAVEVFTGEIEIPDSELK